MKIALGNDHAGFVLRESVIRYLNNRQICVLDFGAEIYDHEDSYTKPAFQVGEAIRTGKADAGVLMCGTGYGISITVNKVNGIRAVPCPNPESAKLAKAHNNINVIALGGRIIKPEEVPAILSAWLDTPFEGGRHLQRINQILLIEDAVIKHNLPFPS